MSTARSIAERAWSAAEGFGTIGVAQAELKIIIENEFADVVETDERVRELVAAAQRVLHILSVSSYPDTIAKLEAALKPFRVKP